MGLLESKAFESILTLLNSFAFEWPTLSQAVTIEAIQETLKKDKKALNASPRFVLLEQIGKCANFQGQYCQAVPALKVKKALEDALFLSVKR